MLHLFLPPGTEPQSVFDRVLEFLSRRQEEYQAAASVSTNPEYRREHQKNADFIYNMIQYLCGQRAKIEGCHHVP